MANKPSKKKRQPAVKKFRKKHPRFARLINYFATKKSQIQAERRKHIHLHKSFRRSYREDYHRETKTPGLLSHAIETFRIIFKHWRVFLPLLLVSVFAFIILVGLMNEEFYQELQAVASEPLDGATTPLKISNLTKAALILISTVPTAGLDSGMDEAETVFAVMIFAIIWLSTIYLLRHFLAGRKPKLRDALYNSCTPLVAILVSIVIIFIQVIPILLVLISYDAALVSGFLSQPFYALVYFIFASLMLILSGYLLSSSIIALVAATAPGVYPLNALLSASDLMAGRRIKFIIRLVYLVFVIALLYIVIMLPIILLDMWLKSFWTFIASWPIMPFMLLITTCFVFIYIATYLYLYYRYLIACSEEEE